MARLQIFAFQSLLALVVAAFCSAAHSSYAQQAIGDTPLIGVGNTIEEVAAKLKQVKIDLRESGFQEAMRPDVNEVADAVFNLSSEMTVRLYYARRTHQVTHIHLYVSSKDYRVKGSDAVYAVAGVRFEDNGDYSLRFIKPTND